MQQRQTLLQFPCKFAVKAMGLANDKIDIIAIAIIAGISVILNKVL